MVFSSLIFLFGFLPVLLLLVLPLLKKGKIQISNIVLLIGSLLFVLWGSGLDILILLAIITTNYFAGIMLVAGNNERLKKTGRSTWQKMILTGCLTISLGLLMFFKYSPFVAYNTNQTLSIVGISWQPPPFLSQITLPLGISFYTFQALSYTIDVYRGNVKATYSFTNFALYVSLFPQLIAGPIVRYKDIHRQICGRQSDINGIYQGAMRFLMGLSKKVLLANIVAKAADGVFSLPHEELYFAIAWIGVIAYTLQIYLDFSAYSDMAIGLAKIFGFELLENFNFPYTAKSMQDFWGRWHISLSTWFRDYLYIPLGGNRKGTLRTYRNLCIVFLLCGLWHGAAWTFVIWGLWNGFFLIAERTFFEKQLKKMPAFVQHLYTMLIVSTGWAIFRSDTLTYATAYIKSMFGLKSFSGTLWHNPGEFLQADILIAIILGTIVSLGTVKLLREQAKRSPYRETFEHVFAVATILLFLLSITSLYSGAYNPFIYFRF